MSPQSDVIIVGAGIAGAAASIVLAREGVRVTLVDPRASCPPCFKAEKIEPDQAALLGRLGLLAAFDGAAGITRVVQARAGRIYTVRRINQLGLRYHDMVNALRAALPSTVRFRVGRVKDIETSDCHQRVTLNSGERLTSRLVVLASGGTAADLQRRLGLRRRMIQRDQSLAFGFTIAHPDRHPFPFEAMRCLPATCDHQISYLTLFRVGDSMRANLFVFWSVRDARVQQLASAPYEALLALLPKLSAATGPFEVVGSVEIGRSDLYRTENVLQPGLVLIGDAFQSSCPSVGDGLSKALTDVIVLCQTCIPAWLTAEKVGVDQIRSFYTHPAKRAMDEQSIVRARRHRQMALGRSLRWRAQRLGRRIRLRLEGWSQAIG